MKKRIGIAGYGFVGSTYAEALEKYHDLYIVDPKLNDNKFNGQELDGVIVCVPTPSNADGSCDYSALIDVMDDIDNPLTPILIKSTIDLRAWEYLYNHYANPFCFSPEFLRQEHATRDLEKSERVILSGEATHYWWEVLTESKVFRMKMYSHYERVEDAIISKYVINSFLAMKVSFFNQLYDFCLDRDISFETVRSIVRGDERIGDSHTHVTKERGWGGACFPKDTEAFLNMDYRNRLTLLENAVEYNKELKKSP